MLGMCISVRGKFFRNQILLDCLGRWRNQSCQIFFQSVHSDVFGKGSNFAIFSVNHGWPLQLLYYRTTVIYIIFLLLYYFIIIYLFYLKQFLKIMEPTHSWLTCCPKFRYIWRNPRASSWRSTGPSRSISSSPASSPRRGGPRGRRSDEPPSTCPPTNPASNNDSIITKYKNYTNMIRAKYEYDTKHTNMIQTW